MPSPVAVPGGQRHGNVDVEKVERPEHLEIAPQPPQDLPPVVENEHLVADVKGKGNIRARGNRKNVPG